MMLVCEEYIAKLTHSQVGAHATQNADISSAVQAEISALLTGKTYEELAKLQNQVQAKLAGSEPVDVDYWESLLKGLVVWKARVRYYITVITIETSFS
jgi:hypothetical protein